MFSVPRIGFWQGQQKNTSQKHTRNPIIIILLLPKTINIEKQTPYIWPGGTNSNIVLFSNKFDWFLCLLMCFYSIASMSSPFFHWVPLIFLDVR